MLIFLISLIFYFYEIPDSGRKSNKNATIEVNIDLVLQENIPQMTTLPQFTFVNENTYTIDSRVKNLKKKYELKCDFCGLGFDTKTSIYKHLEINHQTLILSTQICVEVKDRVCKYCEDKTFQLKCAFDNHMEYHEKMTTHVCKFCGKSFQKLIYYDYHLETVHGNLKNYRCDKCDKIFYNPTFLKKHIKNNHEGRNHCNICNKTLSKGALPDHMRCVMFMKDIRDQLQQIYVIFVAMCSNIHIPSLNI